MARNEDFFGWQNSHFRLEREVLNGLLDGGEIRGGEEDEIISALTIRRKIVGLRRELLFTKKLAGSMEIDAVRLQSKQVRINGIDMMMGKHDGGLA